MRKILMLFLALLIAISTCWTPWQQSVSAQEVQEVGLDEETLAKYQSLDDPALLEYIENSVYHDVVSQIDNNQYIVENVQAVYVSKEYLEELEYNSKENEWFGYKSSELTQMFQGKQYMFTLGKDGNTEVKEFEHWQEDNLTKIMKNVAIGTGVILVCVTVSVATAGTAPAISVIFAASAKTATTMAVSSSLIGGAVDGIVQGVQTGDINQALEDAALSGSEGFKVGAITGAVTGGAGKWLQLRNYVKAGNLGYNQVAEAQKLKYPAEIIKGMTPAEFELYKKEGLRAYKIKDRIVLLNPAKIKAQLSQVVEEGITNAQRLSQGKSLIDVATGDPYELHHVLQDKEGVLALLPKEIHRGAGNFKILHDFSKEGVHKTLTLTEWERQRRELFKGLLELLRRLN